MENWRTSPYTNAHSTSASNASSPTMAGCKIVPKPCNLRTLTNSDPRTFYAKTVVCASQVTDRRCVRSMATNLSTSNACTAALWQCSFALEAPIPSAHLAIMTPWQETSMLRLSVRVVTDAHWDCINTLLLVITRAILNFRWVAVYVDQKSLL